MPLEKQSAPVSPKEALKILEEAYAYYTPLHVFVPGQREPAEYYEYCAS